MKATKLQQQLAYRLDKIHAEFERRNSVLIEEKQNAQRCIDAIAAVKQAKLELANALKFQAAITDTELAELTAQRLLEIWKE